MLLPSLSDCGNGNNQSKIVFGSHCDANGCHSDDYCSPFCGEPGCGIDLTVLFNTAQLATFPAVEIIPVSLLEFTSGDSIMSIWHPPKVSQGSVS